MFHNRNILALSRQILMQLLDIKRSINNPRLLINNGRVLALNLWYFSSLIILFKLIVVLADLDVLWTRLFSDFLVVVIGLWVVVVVDKLVGVDELLSEGFLELWPVFC